LLDAKLWEAREPINKRMKSEASSGLRDGVSATCFPALPSADQNASPQTHYARAVIGPIIYIALAEMRIA
jgi:hypothetical protein